MHIHTHARKKKSEELSQNIKNLVNVSYNFLVCFSLYFFFFFSSKFYLYNQVENYFKMLYLQINSHHI